MYPALTTSSTGVNVAASSYRREPALAMLW